MPNSTSIRGSSKFISASRTPTHACAFLLPHGEDDLVAMVILGIYINQTSGSYVIATVAVASDECSTAVPISFSFFGSRFELPQQCQKHRPNLFLPSVCTAGRQVKAARARIKRCQVGRPARLHDLRATRYRTASTSVGCSENEGHYRRTWPGLFGGEGLLLTGGIPPLSAFCVLAA